MNSNKTFFGHPRGLATLFFTEMWERFSYYGMRALLFLFMVATLEEGGLGMNEKTAGAIYGLYTMFVYLLALPGGWLADRFFGLRKSVFYGGCIIALGHFCLAIPKTETFFLGLLLIVMGTGLLKPNISSLVGTLYPIDQQARRDAGFSIFYMGINVGATISPFITGYLGENVNWHYGFAVAGVGMVLGVIQYRMTEHYLGSAGLPADTKNDPALRASHARIGKVLWITLGLLAILVTLLFFHIIEINPEAFARVSGYVIIASAVLYFAYVYFFENLDEVERKKILAISIFFFVSSMFYAGFEQQGSSLNLFAERYTNMFIGNFEMPASWMQSVPTIIVVVFVPIFAWLWVWLAKRNMNPSTPVKMSFGLIFMGLGYLVMMGASLVVVHGTKPWPTWLIMTYTLHTFGEICLYPIGLSAVTKLVPQRLIGQMMGIWFMSLAFGNLIAGLFAGEFQADEITKNPSLLIDLFGVVMRVMLIAGAVALVFSKPIRKLMGDIR